MKIATTKIGSFINTLPENIKTVLLFGPDQGLVRERAEVLVHGMVGNLSDPFRVAEISANNLRDDPALLFDEASAISFTGERRVVRVRDVTESISKIIIDYCEKTPGEALVIIEAGNLTPRSKIRAIYEKASHGAAIGCYSDEGTTIKEIIIETLDKENLKAAPDTISYLIENLGGDRMVSRSELNKLCLYMEGHTEISMEDAMACVGDSASMVIDDIAFAAASGDLEKLLRFMERALNEGATPISLLRRTSRHFERLHLVGSAIEEGAAAAAAMKLLRPPVFFKHISAFQTHVRLWSTRKLEQALGSLTQAEIHCKTTGFPSEVICNQELLRLAARANLLARR